MTKALPTYKDLLGYEPSEYQNKIFDFVVHGHGNGVIKARAGSGKTHTIITCMKLIPPKKQCLFLAFNKSVKDEIIKKLDGRTNCTVKTVHGLGYSIMSKYLKSEFQLDDYKYSTYLRNNIKELSTEKVGGKHKFPEYLDRILELLGFARMDLVQSRKEIQKCAKTHGVELKYDEDIVVKKLMDWGKSNLETLDYTDLVWLPNELVIDPKFDKYDWIFNDEAQDYSIAYVNLFMKCFKRGTRFVSCGDEFQSINQFAGSSDEAFNMMLKYRNTEQFYLPISYRCDSKIIEEAQNFVPDIQARTDAGLGIVDTESHIKDIIDNDMVLSRTNAPLFKMYAKLIKLGKACYIKGQDNDKEKLLRCIDRYAVDDNLGESFKTDGLYPRMYRAMVDERNRLVEEGLDIHDAIGAPSVQYIYDTIATITTIGSDCTSVSELKNKINNIYSKSHTGICLTTIHKAKGLEAENVHILNRSDMPNKYAKTDSELQQERNLIYVAVTRAKHKLCYVSEKEFPSMKIISNEGDDLTEFNYIEANVCKLYNLKPLKPIKNVEVSKVRLTMATNIGAHHDNDNKKVLNTKKLGSEERKTKLLNKLLQ